MKITITVQGLILFVTFACGAIVLMLPRASGQNADTALVVKDSEEYAVYGAILDSEYANPKLKQFVIASATNTKTKHAFVGFIGGFTGTGARRPEPESETSSDFDAKNDTSYVLERRFDLKVPYVLATEDQLRTIFVLDAEKHPDLDSWKRFYDEYPGAPGIIAFSRTGFNSKKDEALVLVVTQRGWLGGNTKFYVLSKGPKGWEIQTRVLIRLS